MIITSVNVLCFSYLIKLYTIQNYKTGSSLTLNIIWGLPET